MTISVTSVNLSQVEDGAQNILKTSWEGCPGALPFSFALSTWDFLGFKCYCLQEGAWSLCPVLGFISPLQSLCKWRQGSSAQGPRRCLSYLDCMRLSSLTFYLLVTTFLASGLPGFPSSFVVVVV